MCCQAVSCDVQVLDKVLTDKEKTPDKAQLELKGELLKELKWDHWAMLHDASSQQSFPNDYAVL
jgi:hypothetical protein